MTIFSTNRETTISTTKMSSKGQVVIPEQIRAQLNLEAGSQFVVVGDKDVVILKRISAPTLSEFDGGPLFSRVVMPLYIFCGEQLG